MKLLFCCEFYHPSVGGVQKVMREIAERMVKRGHQVTVATSYLPDRVSTEINGVHIAEFRVSGNLVSGMQGEVDKYRQFVKGFPCDAIMVKAAQQWTFDALWPVLDQITARKVFIPCGFSGLYQPNYEKYFWDLQFVLHQWDHLIFYSDNYRDINFARAIGVTNLSVIPNGASELEFSVKPKRDFRASYSIPEDSFVFLTVGTLTGAKGHQELAEAFAKMDTHGKHATLILVGDQPLSPPKMILQDESVPVAPVVGAELSPKKAQAFVRFFYKCYEKVMRLTRKVFHLIKGVGRFCRVYYQEGFPGVKTRFVHYRMSLEYRLKCLIERTPRTEASRELFYNFMRFKQLKKAIEASPAKQLHLVALPRAEVIEAFFAANLFVFASKIECSPLVLYEAAAAGVPVLSVPVGNAEEILQWTAGGSICPAEVDDNGYIKVDTSLLAMKMSEAMSAPEALAQQGVEAQDRWAKHFTWEKIAERYEGVLQGCHHTILRSQR